MSYLIKPANYKPLLDLKQTELGIKQIKEFFQQNLSSELRLRRVTAPLFVLKGMGINDDLSGTERPVSFPIKDLGDAQAEVVHSLAKWKRFALHRYKFQPGSGLYTDIGMYWNRKGENEIDLITLNDLDKTAAIYEIKKDESRYSITKLEEKVTSLLEAEKELKKYSLDLGKLSLRDM